MPTPVTSHMLLRYCCDGCVCVVETIDIIGVSKDGPAPARRREPTRRPRASCRTTFASQIEVCPHPSPMTSPAPGGPSDVETKGKQTTYAMRGSEAEMILRQWCRFSAFRVVSHFCVTAVLRHAAVVEAPPQPVEVLRLAPERRCLLRADSVPTGTASGKTAVRAKAAVPLQAGNRLQCSNQTYANRDTSDTASAISGISGVGEKPSTAGASTAWASASRLVDW
jgi:hypothetical protein